MCARILASFSVAAVVVAASLLACSPPAECVPLAQARDQDKATVDALASAGAAGDSKQSAESAKAYRDASSKMKASLARVDALKPSDLRVAQAAKAYATAARQVTSTLDAIADRFDKLVAAQTKVEAAEQRFAASKGKVAPACATKPAPGGCADFPRVAAQSPVDDAARKQMIRDLESLKLDAPLVPVRTDLIAAVKDLDAARKELASLDVDPKAALSTTALTDAARDVDKQCAAK